MLPALPCRGIKRTHTHKSASITHQCSEVTLHTYTWEAAKWVEMNRGLCHKLDIKDEFVFLYVKYEATDNS